MKPTDSTPLGKAKDWLTDKLESGDQVVCPCCSQKAQVHPWSFNAKMAYALYQLYLLDRRTPGRAVHLYKEIVNPNPARTNRSAGQLHHWGLMERACCSAPGEPSGGLWRIVRKGKLFVLGRISIEQTIFVFDGFCVSKSEGTLTFLESLSVPFSYDQVRNGAPLPQ